MTKEPNSQNKVIARVWSKLDPRITDNYTKNLFFCNLANVLANFFGNFLPILMDFYSFFAFFVSFFYLIISANINNFKPFDFIFFSSFGIYNLGNIFAFYYWLFVYLIVKSLSNTISTNISYFFSNSIKLEWENCFYY